MKRLICAEHLKDRLDMMFPEDSLVNVKQIYKCIDKEPTADNSGWIMLIPVLVFLVLMVMLYISL